MTTPDSNAITHASSVTHAVRCSRRRLNVSVGMAVVKTFCNATNQRCAGLDRRQTSVQADKRPEVRVDRPGCKARRRAMPTIRSLSLARPLTNHATKPTTRMATRIGTQIPPSPPIQLPTPHMPPFIMLANYAGKRSMSVRQRTLGRRNAGGPMSLGLH